MDSRSLTVGSVTGCRAEHLDKFGTVQFEIMVCYGFGSGGSMVRYFIQHLVRYPYHSNNMNVQIIFCTFVVLCSYGTVPF